ncbi:MAG: GMC family oxidoreductase [Deltaproteobacteria bacterium]|nr:GMC family oxidoreductase [Deltaproteobacteria bacterium]
MDDDLADFIIIGSGFGGSVSALRLAERGYTVRVLEEGRRWRAEDFPRSNWQLRDYLWLPSLGLRGIQRLSLHRHFLGLSGAGVGGGSLVYAATLLEPPEAFYRDPRWDQLDPDWRATLAPHYATARRMLGVTQTPRQWASDELLRQYGRALGREDRWAPTEVGILFGEHPGERVPDPFFGGEGPERTTCDLGGACMVGCRTGGKNTLDKNYLYLAERLGVEVLPETKALSVREVPGGYEVLTRSSRWGRRRTAVHRAKRVVVSAGALGTLRLLHRSRAAGGLSRLSPRLGDVFRTNSEVIVGAMGRDPAARYCEGNAITSSLYVTDDTHIEVVRYPEGSDALGLIASVLADAGPGPRALRWLAAVARDPAAALRSLRLRGWARQGIILLTMQSVDNHLRVAWRRRWWGAMGLRTEASERVPVSIPAANAAARWIAERIGGDAQGALSEVLLDRPVTAHLLGGCPMGRDRDEGVIDAVGRVHGHPGLYVVDGSMISANLGVNPSLTITALAEHAMAAVPEADRG